MSTQADIDPALLDFGAKLREEFPQYLETGTFEEVMARCKTEKQKAGLILRVAGKDLNHDWYDAPEFQAFVAEIRRIANNSTDAAPELVPNDIYVQALTLTREMLKEPTTIDKGHEGVVQNGSHMVANGMNNFISDVVKAGLAETSASRRPRSLPATNADASVERLRK